jgi:hypothetical protein
MGFEPKGKIHEDFWWKFPEQEIPDYYSHFLEGFKKTTPSFQKK